MKYQVCYTNRFKKDLKRCAKRGLNLSKILKVVQILENTGVLGILSVAMDHFIARFSQ